MEEKVLDYYFVPSGLAVMVTYHVWLLHRIIKHPTKTVIGINAINRRFWVRSMMELKHLAFWHTCSLSYQRCCDVSNNGVLSVQTLRNNIMASTLLASTAIMLGSLIAILMASGSKDRSSFFMFGDQSEFSFSIKFFCILSCIMVAFPLNLQSIRYYSHATILINVPFKKMSQDHHHHNLIVEYVAKSVNRGSYFWSLGLRAFYFSLPLFLWIFGPISMFVSCHLLVAMLYFLDVTIDYGWVVGVCDDEIPKDEELGRGR
ncbi:hypothetical protein UlMin_024642 [Ulmus minor]